MPSASSKRIPADVRLRGGNPSLTELNQENRGLKVARPSIILPTAKPVPAKHEESQAPAKRPPVAKHAAPQVKDELAPTLSETLIEITKILAAPVFAVGLFTAALVQMKGEQMADIESPVPSVKLVAEAEASIDAPAPDAETVKAFEEASKQTALNAELARKESWLFKLTQFSPKRTVSPRIPTVAEIDDAKGKIKFISGLIAMHRPSIADCGEVARIIVETASREKMDPFYLAAIISIESRFHDQAVSRVGARGLMQLMPETAKLVAKASGKRLSSVTDPQLNIQLGAQYIKNMERRYRGNKTMALAAYNWGPGNVDRVKRGERHIPESVRKYARTVLERSANWSTHYKKAQDSVSHLDGLN